MKGLIGKKIGMTSIFNEGGQLVPVTIIEAGPNYITQIKTEETDGYNAVQLGFGERREKSTSAALKGHFAKAGTGNLRKVAEFKYIEDALEGKDAGAEVSVDMFEEGDYVAVTGTSKGKGFQGVVKRHNFKGVNDQTHGQHNRQRAPGSIGAGSDPSRVFKGMRMAGRTGGKRVTMQNLIVQRIDTENNLIFVKGAVPGSKGSFVIIEG